MKKIYFLASLLATSVAANAQNDYMQDFESQQGVLPENFVLWNLDELIPSQEEEANLIDSAWILIESSITSSKCAYSTSWYVDDAGPCDDWFILPRVTMGSDPSIAWDALSTTSSGDYPDSYMVLISTEEGEPTLDGFNQNLPIKTVDPELHGEQTDPVDSYASHSESLASYAGQTVRIAFRNNTSSGSGLIVDNIHITNGTLASVGQAQDAAASLFPNPAHGLATVRFAVERAGNVSLDLRDISGRLVRSQNVGALGIGQQQAEINLEGVPAGTYLLSIQTPGKRVTQSLVVR